MNNLAKASVTWGGRAALALLAGSLLLAGCSHDRTDYGVAEGSSIKDPNVTAPSARRVVRAKLDRTAAVDRAVPGGSYAVASGGARPAVLADRAPKSAAHDDYKPSEATMASVDLPARRPRIQAVGETCLADSTCRGRLAELVADEGAAWLRGTPALADDLSGVRFLAVRKLKQKLTCANIEFARGSLAGSQERLALIERRSVAGADEQARASGAISLAAAVLSDLAREQQRRCG